MRKRQTVRQLRLFLPVPEGIRFLVRIGARLCQGENNYDIVECFDQPPKSERTNIWFEASPKPARHWWNLLTRQENNWKVDCIQHIKCLYSRMSIANTVTDS